MLGLEGSRFRSLGPTFDLLQGIEGLFLISGKLGFRI